jgi:tetratricopeptide (TPR) repeat protein
MTTRQHTDTDSRLAGLDARIQDFLAWITDHHRAFLAALGALVLLVAIAAAWWEVSRSRRAAASAELAAIEAGFVTEMGSDRTAAMVSEPANPETAKSAREAALAKFESFAQAHGNSDLANDARLRSAELEVDLGRLAAADSRLADLVANLDDRDPRKAMALRLRGYVLEELDRPQEAAALYEAGGALESYPARALLWLAAARTHMRIGANENALAALDRALEIESELGSDPEVASMRREIQAAIAQSPAKPAS